MTLRHGRRQELARRSAWWAAKRHTGDRRQNTSSPSSPASRRELLCHSQGTLHRYQLKRRPGGGALLRVWSRENCTGNACIRKVCPPLCQSLAHLPQNRNLNLNEWCAPSQHLRPLSTLDSKI